MFFFGLQGIVLELPQCIVYQSVTECELGGSKTDLYMHAYVEKWSKYARTNQPPNFRTIISYVTKYSMNQSIKSVSDIDSSIVTSEDSSIHIITFHLHDKCLIRAVGTLISMTLSLLLTTTLPWSNRFPLVLTGGFPLIEIEHSSRLTNIVWHNGGSDLETARTAILLMMFKELVTAIQ